MRISSLTKEGLPELWEKIKEFREKSTESGSLERKRQRQQTVWMWNHIRDNIMSLFKKHPPIARKIPKYEHLVAKGAVTPGYAADLLLQDFATSICENVVMETLQSHEAKHEGDSSENNMDTKHESKTNTETKREGENKTENS